MFRFHFRLRTLFVLTTVAAILTFPTYHAVNDWLEKREREKLASAQLPTITSTTIQTGITVPDGGTIIIGGIVIRPDGTRQYPATSSVMPSQYLEIKVTHRIEIQQEEDEQEQPIVLTEPSSIK
jgi:ribosomal protein L27